MAGADPSSLPASSAPALARLSVSPPGAAGFGASAAGAGRSSAGCWLRAWRRLAHGALRLGDEAEGGRCPGPWEITGRGHPEPRPGAGQGLGEVTGCGLSVFRRRPLPDPSAACCAGPDDGRDEIALRDSRRGRPSRGAPLALAGQYRRSEPLKTGKSGRPRRSRPAHRSGPRHALRGSVSSAGPCHGRPHGGSNCCRSPGRAPALVFPLLPASRSVPLGRPQGRVRPSGSVRPPASDAVHRRGAVGRRIV